MRPNIESRDAPEAVTQAHSDDRAPRQRARRVRADRRAVRHDRRSDRRPAAGRGRRGARQGASSAGRRGWSSSSSKAVRRRPGDAACSRTAATCRRTWKSSEGLSSTPGDTSKLFYLVRSARRSITGRDLRNARQTVDEFNQPAVELHAEQRRRGQVQQGDRREHRPSAGDRPRRPRAVGAGHRRHASSAKARITGSFTQQEADDLALVLRSGALPASLSYLEQRGVGPSLGRDSIRAGVTRLDRRARARHGLHARLLPACGHQRVRLDRAEPDRSCWASWRTSARS